MLVVFNRARWNTMKYVFFVFKNNLLHRSHAFKEQSSLFKVSTTFRISMILVKRYSFCAMPSQLKEHRRPIKLTFMCIEICIHSIHGTRRTHNMNDALQYIVLLQYLPLCVKKLQMISRTQYSNTGSRI